MLEMAEESGINKLGEHIYDLFLAELQQKRFQSFDSDPIGADETPEEIANTFRLEIPNHFFTRGVHGYALPKIFKRTKKEEELTYEYRIRNYLTIMKDENFERIGELLDPEDPLQL